MVARIDKFASDRRSSPRYSVKTALRVRAWKSDTPEHRAQSINVSLRGIYFSTKFSLCQGEIVQVLLKMPQEVSGERTTEWRCTGHVVRVEPRDSPDGAMRVGVQFYCYDVARPEQPPLPVAAGSSWRAILQAEQIHATKRVAANGQETKFNQVEIRSQNDAAAS